MLTANKKHIQKKASSKIKILTANKYITKKLATCLLLNES